MIFFGWGAKAIPLGIHAAVCGACGHDGVLHYFFRYRYAGIFWLGSAWHRQIIAECPFCGGVYASPLQRTDPDAQHLAGQVAWNYRFGWMIWAGLFTLIFLTSFW